MPVLSLLMAFTQGPAVPYPVFENDKIPPAVYRARRQRLKEELGPNTVALVLTNPTRNRSNDTDFRFRAESNFLYLTGFEEPDAALLLVPSGIELDGRRVTEVLFTNVSDPMSETWLGYRMGPANAVKLLGIESARPNDEFRTVLQTIKPQEWATLPIADPTGTIQRMTKDFFTWRGNALRAKLSLERALARMRTKKSPEEIALLKKAINATVLAHAEAIRSIEPGMWEYEIQAVVEHVFTRYGCEAVAYNSIVGSGQNSCILHYESNRRKTVAGDLICMDVGGEYHGYAADVTRTYPVNGKFSPEQRAIYNIVLAAQEAGIRECRVGNTFDMPHRAAAGVLFNGLKRLGIVKNESEMDRYFMHGTSHYIGLDVHDAHGDNTLQSNYTLTVEPGIYIKAGSPCDKKWWNIGVRIEDDVLVTTNGPVNLSGALPRKVEAVEALMRERGIGNTVIKPPAK